MTLDKSLYVRILSGSAGEINNVVESTRNLAKL